MNLYADTELDSDIRYVKEMLSHYRATYKGIGENFTKLNETVSGRMCFISSQFKILFNQ